jgi:hypothetical protein
MIYCAMYVFNAARSIVRSLLVFIEWWFRSKKILQYQVTRSWASQGQVLKTQIVNLNPYGAKYGYAPCGNCCVVLGSLLIGLGP